MKISHILGNVNPGKKNYVFSRECFSYISGNEAPKKLLIFQDLTFRTWIVKITRSEKTFYIFESKTFQPQV